MICRSILGLTLASWLRSKAQLLHQAQFILVEPALDDLAILDALDRNPTHLNPFIRWWMSLKFAAVSSLPRHSRRDPIPLGDLIFNHNMNIAKGGGKPVYSL